MLTVQWRVKRGKFQRVRNANCGKQRSIGETILGRFKLMVRDGL